MVSGAAFDSRNRKFKRSIEIRYKREEKGEKKPNKNSWMMRFRASLVIFKIHMFSPSDLAV